MLARMSHGQIDGMLGVEDGVCPHQGRLCLLLLLRNGHGFDEGLELSRLVVRPVVF